ncbi:MAG: winged helix-turn-helix domain-containing protein [Pseudomonadota bacterium]
MQYRWGDFSLDRTGSLLTLRGCQIEASRKVLDCILHLVEHHDRVVGYDELILAIWRHDNVSNHQLSQIVLQTRRAIGDDGQAQHSIRTVPGIGYRWVAAFRPPEEPAELPTTTSLAASCEEMPEAPSVAPPPAPESARSAAAAHVNLPKKRRLRVAAMLSLCLVVLAVGPQRIESLPSKGSIGATLSSGADYALSSDPIGSLRQALFMGRFEQVREGLAGLAPDIADGMEARLIEIELDIRRGRYARADEKLSIQMARAEAAGDPVWRARLLLQHSEL